MNEPARSPVLQETSPELLAASDEAFYGRERRPLESVLSTAELSRRLTRPPNYEVENRALGSLMKAMAASPADILQKLVETALVLCRAHSAGVSLAEEKNGQKIFRWNAVTGRWSHFLGGTMLREDSPCGTVLDRNACLLFSHPERHFPFPKAVTPDVVEVLLVPFHAAGDEPIGTIWVIAHDESRQFDAEDQRLMTSLGKFASTAHQVLSSLEALKVQIRERERVEEALRQAQASLANRAGQLEQIVAARTADLQASNKEMESFVYSIAHDLRAPLRSMMGFSQLLVEEHASGLNELAKEMLTRIRGSSAFMDEMLFDLLAYARVARAELNIEPVKVADAWQAAMAKCAAQIETLAGHVQTDEPLPTIRADQTMLGEALAHLLSNALKFVAPGTEPRVRFRAEDCGENLRLWVEDNGIGIAEEHCERIFRIFERLHGSRHDGTGIGLSIVRKALERLGGKAGVESAPGKGSRFWIELPKAI